MNSSVLYVAVPIGAFVLLALGLGIGALLLMWGARLAGIQRRSFGRALGVVLLGGIASSLLAGFLRADLYLGTGLGLALGFCVSAVVGMALFDTSFGKALAAALLAWVLGFVLAIVIGLVGLALAGIFIVIAS